MIQNAILAFSLALAGHFVSVIAVLQFRSGQSPILLHLISALVWHVLQIVMLIAWGAGSCYWQSAALYAFCVLAYVFIFSAAYKSISLRAVTLLADSKDSTVTLTEIMEKLVLKSFYDRIDVLLGAGLVAKDQSGFSITAQGRLTANRIVALRKFFGARSNGLYFSGTDKTKPH
jgi:asparagine N-glycosylation enzyme membrane subunit Stt3